MQITDLQKKILYIVMLVVATGLLGFLIYFLFFKPPTTQYVNSNGNMIPVTDLFPSINLSVNKQTGNENINTGFVAPQIDAVAQGGNTLADTVLDEKTQDATLTQDGKSMQYYDADEGKFYRINENGEKELMTDEIFKGVEITNWSNSSNAAVLEFSDGYNLYYDFKTKKQYTLSKEMKDFSFSPQDNQIAYKYMAIDPEDRWLGVINPDGSGVQQIERLGENEQKVQVNWSPSGVAVGTFNEYTDGDTQRVIPLGLNGENFKSMAVEGRDFTYQWAPDGKQMLYSVYSASSDYKPTLWITDAQGDDIGNNRQPLSINTWAEKCTFASTSEVYCAVPQSLPTGAGIDRGSAYDMADSIYKINVKTRKSTLVAIPTDQSGTANYSVQSMQLSADGSSLFFTDNNEQKIHKIKLK